MTKQQIAMIRQQIATRLEAANRLELTIIQVLNHFDIFDLGVIEIIVRMLFPNGTRRFPIVL